jgi:HJR/Mrr/RecB family endonuclease
MARRRKKGLNAFEIVPAIAGFIALPFVFPKMGAALFGFASALVWFAIFVLISVTLILIFRLSRGSTTKSAEIVAPDVIVPSANAEPKTLSKQLRSIDWFQFEKLLQLAYSDTHTVTRLGGANPDGGIDLIIENESGRAAVQCKHWKRWKVGVRNVRELIGAMKIAGINRGILVTVKGYSADAAELARQESIELLDEADVCQLLERVDQSKLQGILSDTPKFCPKCEREMVRRTARRGKNASNEFWGCSGYPQCTYVLRNDDGRAPE